MKLTKEKTRSVVKIVPYHVNRFLSCWEFWLLCLPAIVLLLIFNYWPMFGSILAFKDFNYQDGILGSDWAGLNNFRFFFLSRDAWRITRNTIGYALIKLILGTVLKITLALLMYQITSKKLLKTYQTIFILPHFMSWVIVSYITYVLLSGEYGVLNQIIRFFGGKGVSWYTEPKYWPFILPIVDQWKTIGMGSLMYYATLVGMDDSIFEAAAIDGAGKWKQITAIILPSLVPMITIMTILEIGNIFRGEFGLFYQIPRDSGALYAATDVIDTYVFRTMRSGDVGVSSAVGLFQSLVGFVMVILTNYVVKKIEPDNAMF